MRPVQLVALLFVPWMLYSFRKDAMRFGQSPGKWLRVGAASFLAGWFLLPAAFFLVAMLVSGAGHVGDMYQYARDSSSINPFGVLGLIGGCVAVFWARRKLRSLAASSPDI
jgi:hypothetical protein